MNASMTLGAAHHLPAGPRRRALACGSIVATFSIGVLLSGCSGSEDPAGGPGDTAEAACADNDLVIAAEDNSFEPTVDFYTVSDDGMTIFLHAQVSAVTPDRTLSWSEDGDLIFIKILFPGSPPEGSDFVYNEVEFELETPLGDRTVCYGTTELTEMASVG
ncbi:MAG: hypothetical protein JW722_04840 [Demequinaceae bacterium]|nr:hypothetical protein [Demequinaceae bacterium]